jgi:hypothetical protein
MKTVASEFAHGYIFFYGYGSANHHLETGFFVHTKMVSAIKSVEFIGDTVSYITLRGRWFDIVLNVHAPIEDESDDNDSFYKELDHVRDQITEIPRENFIKRFQC